MRKRARRTRFVPTVVFGTAVLGAIPACATGCGARTAPLPGGEEEGGAGTDANATADAPVPGSDANVDLPVAFCGFCDSGFLDVVQLGFDAGLDAADAGDGASGDAGGGADSGRDASPRPVPLAYTGFDVRYFGEKG